MSESNAAEQEVAENATQENKKDFTHKFTKMVLIIAGLYFVWYLVSDRITPITDNARVRAFVIPIVPEVSGTITKIHVGGDKVVNLGDPLFEIDNRDYVLAQQQARASLELAGQEVGANTASVAAAEASVAKAEADLSLKQANANRILPLEAQGVVSFSDADRARSQLAQAEQNVANAKAAYEQAKQTLGQTGQENAKVQSAMAQLRLAELNLERTKINAPGRGAISYAKVYEGYYAKAGSQVMTYISSDYVWIEASYRENNLANIDKGDSVDIVLDALPGKVISGTIQSVGYGVDFDKSKPGSLPVPEKSTSWMRDPQRFTVIIKFDDPRAIGQLREGGQADVITYTGNNFVFNALGKVYIRLISWFSYIY
ncbi:HlyD family secretion protein [Thalassotalea agarivorans]|uniref:Multidrug resistance efflux pump n=1 Tax=Thalassotalea agarivorans TaxID=349064 RepID=A0A1H9YD89_THASX|nr:HlyD family secretion protein [Thalassotalea agarivorans]SES66430.1 Multidrug resistance efflux pump [Thalassotalea agarivorans]